MENSNNRYKFRAWDKRFKTMNYGAGDLLLRINEKDFSEPQQYTGLKDKNGKEIYEGDIVKENRFGSLSQIIWTQGEGSTVGIVKGMFGEESDLNGFIHELGKFEFKGVKCKTKAHYIGEFEVIGNIYENPELLTNPL